MLWTVWELGVSRKFLTFLLLVVGVEKLAKEIDQRKNQQITMTEIFCKINGKEFHFNKWNCEWDRRPFSNTIVIEHNKRIIVFPASACVTSVYKQQH